MKLNADDLVLPMGCLHAIKTNGVREIASYHIPTDTFFVRWDTVIDGVQYSVKKVRPTNTGMDFIEFAESQRADSILRLISIAKDKMEVMVEMKVFIPTKK